MHVHLNATGSRNYYVRLSQIFHNNIITKYTKYYIGYKY